MQQIVQMLAKLQASQDYNQEKMEAYQEKMAADRKADKEESRGANQELMTRMEAKFDDNQKKVEADKEDLLTKMKEDRKADKEDLLARMDAMFETYKKRIMATKKTEKNPGMTQSIEEHQDVPNEDVTVMPVKGLKKRRRVWKSTAERRGEPKELNQGNCGSRRKLDAACRKVSHRATVAWRKRKLFRKSETRGYCDSRKGVTVADRRTSRQATVAWRKRKLTIFIPSVTLF
jgi:hypothetical protein